MIEKNIEKKSRIYYAEDDGDIAESVKAYLERRNFDVWIFRTMEETESALLRGLPDLILIDRNLPEGNGLQLCGRIRRRYGEGLPILFLTVRGDTEDIVEGFKSGADDYVVKPFEPEVLYSRILAVLRRSGGAGNPILSCDGISLDRDRTVVRLNGEEVTLSRPEYGLLLYLMEHKGRTVVREKLLGEIWDAEGNYVNDNTLTVAMKRLREKLGNPSCIRTVRSFGYRMEDTV